MNKSDILALLDYNFWANARIVDTAENIPVTDLIKLIEPNPGWGSLRGILVHTLDVEIGWRSIVQSNLMAPDLVEAEFGDVPALRAAWAVEKQAWFDFVGGLSDARLNEHYSYQFGDGPKRTRKVWQTIAHVINHGTQHRSEAAMLLTGYGQSPGELDFGLFLRDHPEHVQAAEG